MNSLRLILALLSFIKASLASFIQSYLFLDIITDRYYLKTSLSYQKHQAISFIDLAGNYSVVKENRRYNLETPTTIKQIANSGIDNTEYNLVQDEFILEKKVIHNFPFLLQISFNGKNYDDYPIPSTVSLSRSASSLLNQLYHSGLISKRIITFSRISLELGDSPLPKAIAYHYIPLNEHGSASFWSTDLIGVITGVMNLTDKGDEVMIDVKNYTNFDQAFPFVFNSTENGMVFPVEYVDFFRFGFFELFLSLHKCFLKKEGGDKVFECDRKAQDYFDDLFLFFDGVMVMYRTKELFYSLDDRTMRSKISFREGVRHVSFGIGYILGKAMVFNEEDKVIGFKADDSVFKVKANFNYISKVTKTKRNLPIGQFSFKVIMLILICSLLSGILLLLSAKIIKLN